MLYNLDERKRYEEQKKSKKTSTKKGRNERSLIPFHPSNSPFYIFRQKGRWNWFVWLFFLRSTSKRMMPNDPQIRLFILWAALAREKVEELRRISWRFVIVGVASSFSLPTRIFYSATFLWCSLSLLWFSSSFDVKWVCVWVRVGLFEQHKANLFLFADLTLHFGFHFVWKKFFGIGYCELECETFLLCGSRLKVSQVLRYFQGYPSTAIPTRIQLHHELYVVYARKHSARVDHFPIDFLNFTYNRKLRVFKK